MIIYNIAIVTCCVSAVLSLSEFEQKKLNGTERYACSDFGSVRQPERRVNTTIRLKELRKLMNNVTVLKDAAIDAYIVRYSDEHQSTEIENYEKRRQYISGFSGTYGDAVITQAHAALWTDGRYHLQADEQLDCNWRLFREGHRGVPTLSQWLRQKNLPKNGRIGLNPKLVSEYMWNKLTTELKGSTLSLVALKVDPIDVLWRPEERGTRQRKSSFILDIKYTGKNYTTKINETREAMKSLGADAMVVTALDEIAWLLNIRGRDIPFAVFLRSYVILDMKYIYIYVDKDKINSQSREYLHAGDVIIEKDSVILRDYDNFWLDLPTKCQNYRKVVVPSHFVYSEGASHAVYEHISPEKRMPRPSPIIHLKSTKNSIEIKNMREANIIDGSAMCDCLAYMENKMMKGDPLTEGDLVHYLNQHRFERNQSSGNSFRTIVAFGPNAAYPKYEPTPNRNVTVFRNSTIVLDSGGQYYGGTTVVTRTVHYGEPTDDMMEAYTRVLIGIIQLSMLTFPNITKMGIVDALTRSALWEVGVDYEQESGHGIGLGTHESPAKVHYNSEISLHHVFKPGYFITNALGYYRQGEFGVRLENVLEVYEKKQLQRSSGNKYLGFRSVTLVPFELKLIKLSLLTTPQKRWLNAYNAKIRELVGAKLKELTNWDGFYWMMDRTKFIPERDYGNIIIAHPILLAVTTTAVVLKTYFL